MDVPLFPRRPYKVGRTKDFSAIAKAKGFKVGDTVSSVDDSALKGKIAGFNERGMLLEGKRDAYNPERFQIGA